MDEDIKWVDMVEPITTKLHVSGKFGGRVTFHGDGAVAMADHIRRMAELLDLEEALRKQRMALREQAVDQLKWLAIWAAGVGVLAYFFG